MMNIAIIGLGKIARERHLPALHADGGYKLVATVDPSGASIPDVPAFRTYDELVNCCPGSLDAVALCTPPRPRFELARKCLGAGLHVLLEKPPTATLGEAYHLLQAAETRQLSIFSAWHHRYNPAVQLAKQYMREKKVTLFRVNWFEDWRVWHPGQSWVWEPGGFGVFDAGINALSLLSSMMVPPLIVTRAELAYEGAGQVPIRAHLTLDRPGGLSGDVSLDWTGEQAEQRDIVFEFENGERLDLRKGGSELVIAGQPLPVEGPGEYQSIYERFRTLIGNRACDFDIEPLRITADAFLLGRRA